MAKDRKTPLEPRKANTRQQRNVVKFGLKDIREHFEANMRSVEELHAIADKLSSVGEEQKADDIRRAQIVFMESAFDFFLHELAKLGIVEHFHENWDGKKDHFLKLKVTMNEVVQAVNNSGSDQWLLEWIDATYSEKTLFSYDKFCEICNLLDISIPDIARGLSLSGNADTVKNQLKDRITKVYDWRNRIAHQADRDSGNAQKQPITQEDVTSCRKDIQNIVKAVLEEAEKKLKP